MTRAVAALCALALAACHFGGANAVAVDLGPLDVSRTCTADDAPPTCDPGASGATNVYVVSQLVFPEATVDNVEPGFDLDGTDATFCNAMDWSSIPPLAAGCGVDNALAPLVATLVSDVPSRAVAAGQLVMLLVVSGIDDMTNDDCVGVRFAIGALPSGVTTPMLLPDGGVASGQTLDVDARSIAADGTSWRYGFAAGRIVGGRLQAASGEAAWPLTITSVGWPLTSTARTLYVPLHSARIDVAVDGSGLHFGVLGGASKVVETLDELVAAGGCADVPLLGPLLQANADLDPFGVRLAEGGVVQVCHSASIGLTFEAVPALLSSCTTSATCGAARRCVAGHCTADAPDAGPPCVDGGP